MCIRLASSPGWRARRLRRRPVCEYALSRPGRTDPGYLQLAQRGRRYDQLLGTDLRAAARLRSRSISVNSARIFIRATSSPASRSSPRARKATTTPAAPSASWKKSPTSIPTFTATSSRTARAPSSIMTPTFAETRSRRLPFRGRAHALLDAHHRRRHRHASRPDSVPGSPASHGCIRMSRAVAAEFFAHAKVGMPVRIVY